DRAVARLGRLAVDAGIKGLVCSPEECASLRAELGGEPLLVVPGIRPSGSARDDQHRAATPARAIEEGADILVVGRPIRAAADPVAAARSIVAEIAAASPH
ncbi:MAG: orotidine 5'-phosphate decarboxylase, partial [Polyangiaceae bacterium]|nr:orotidine 5'-phosphate decarboxylase [Polyangiaceae bacterium]